MTENQAAWAGAHDWYVRCTYEGDFYTVEVWDSTEQKLVQFDNYQELRRWAGY